MVPFFSSAYLVFSSVNKNKRIVFILNFLSFLSCTLSLSLSLLFFSFKNQDRSLVYRNISTIVVLGIEKKRTYIRIKHHKFNKKKEIFETKLWIRWIFKTLCLLISMN